MCHIVSHHVFSTLPSIISFSTLSSSHFSFLHICHPCHFPHSPLCHSFLHPVSTHPLSQGILILLSILIFFLNVLWTVLLWIGCAAKSHHFCFLCPVFSRRPAPVSTQLCRVWEVMTGEVLNTLIHHNEAVLHLRFANGLMVTCSKDRSIAVWDMASPTDISLRRVLVGHRAAVNVVDFDDKYIVSASGDRTIKVKTCWGDSRTSKKKKRKLFLCTLVYNLRVSCLFIQQGERLKCIKLLLTCCY